MVFDVVVLIIILISAFISFLRGVIREILTILGVVGGLTAAYYGGPILNPHMRGWLGIKDGVEPEKLVGILPYDILAQMLSYGVIFIVVVIALSIISHLLAETARKIGLGPVDRTLGVIFGIARGILLLAIIYMPFYVTVGEEQKKEWFAESKTFFYIEQTTIALAQTVPDDMLDKFRKDAETVKEGVEAQQKMRSIDLLKNEGAPAAKDMPQSDPASPGYTDEFRDEMDELFENKPGAAPTPAPAPATGTPNQ